jgi:hypothetical protein
MASKPSTTKARSLDLGQLQNEVENASRAFKAAGTILSKAQEAYDNAEKNHHASQKALAAGVAQLLAGTKVV